MKNSVAGRSLFLLVLLGITACSSTSDGVKSGLKVEELALTPPSMVLREDTLAALSHDRSDGRRYIGAYTDSIASCSMVDQTPVGSLVVISPDQIRIRDKTCKYEEQSRQGQSYRLGLMCRDESLVDHKEFTVSLSGGDTMFLSDVGGDRLKFIRCKLPAQS